MFHSDMSSERTGLLFLSGTIGLSLGVQLYFSQTRVDVQVGSGDDTAYSKDLLPYVAKQMPPAASDAHQAKFYCERLDEDTALHRAKAFLQLQNQRRSLRFYSPDPYPVELLMTCIATAGTAPSGAHQQPWHFSIVKNMKLKRQIREIVEKEEQLNYDKRMKKTWVQDLDPIFKESALHKDGEIKKPYLTECPYIVVVTEVSYGLNPTSGEKSTHYYVKEGVGIAVGLFVAALTNVGLFSLTSTPLNAGSSICGLLNRPSNEKVFVLMPVGFPAGDATVPFRHDSGSSAIRKDLKDICKIYD